MFGYGYGGKATTLNALHWSTNVTFHSVRHLNQTSRVDVQLSFQNVILRALASWSLPVTSNVSVRFNDIQRYSMLDSLSCFTHVIFIKRNLKMSSYTDFKTKMSHLEKFKL